MSALAKRKLIVRSGDALVLCDLAALKKIGRDDEG
jgi:hypothetical protein